MAKSSIGDKIMRIIISMLGAALILWAVATVTLGFVGERGRAVITNVRRQGGERTDGKSGRYTYIISYTFRLADGKSVDGFSTRISNGTYIKVKQPYTTASIRYFKFFPRFNALEDDTEPNFGKLVLIAAGGFLIFTMNKQKKIRRKRKKQIVRNK